MISRNFTVLILGTKLLLVNGEELLAKLPDPCY